MSARVVIIGGGFAGAAAAVRLIEATRAPIDITIVEPRAEVGRGIAYGTTETGHLMNGPARILSLYPEDPSHLANWLAAEAARGGWRPADPTPWESCQPPRWLFGTYVARQLERARLAAGARVCLTHRRARAAGLTLTPGGVRVLLAEGGTLAADAAVLATGIFRKAASAAVPPALAGDPRYLPDPYAPVAFVGAACANDAVILGGGLTMLDAVVSLDRAGFTGTIRVVSRRGQLVERRRDPAPWTNFFETTEAPSLRALLRMVQKERRALAAQGEDWQRLIPVVREQVPRFWPDLDEADKISFARHLQGIWQSCVHLAPTQSHRLMERLRSEDRLKPVRGYVEGVTPAPDGRLRVELRAAQGRAARALDTDLVVNCMGNTFDWERLDDPFVRGLIDRGIVRPHVTHLGIEADVISHAVIDPASGRPSERIFAIGHPLRGAAWESSSVRELAASARQLAQTLAGSPALATAAPVRPTTAPGVTGHA